VGALTSSILSEVYLQSLEHNSIFKILMEQKIVAYFRYVDDILIIYDKNKTYHTCWIYLTSYILN
jgi:hypothetical protein